MSTNATNTNSNNSSENIPSSQDNLADDNRFGPLAAAKALIGTMVASKYQLLDLLGTGGMSTVYKAQNLLTRKIVAVKLMHTRLLSDEQSLRRFQQEAIAACRLSHPNTINIHDMGIENDQPYMIMDYLEGHSLSDIIKEEGKIDIERCLNIFIQTSNALADAHSRGVIHRDLKPSNIMLVKHGDNDNFVKIVDFGIAKIIAEGAESMKLTNTGDVFGSPPYMSPEQGSGKKLDARSDIYSMGCLMYEAVTGHPPFVGNNAMETIIKQLNDPAPGLGNIDGNIRLVKQLDSIILKCLAKNPNDRYQSMNELQADLDKAALSTQSAYLARIVWYFSRATRNIYQKLFRFRLGIAIFALTSICGLLLLGGIFLFEPSSSGNSIVDRELPLKPIIDPSIKPPNPETGEALWRKIQSPSAREPEALDYTLKKFIQIADLNKKSGNYAMANLWYYRAEIVTGWLKLENSILSANIHNSFAESCLLSNTLLNPPSQIERERLTIDLRKYGKFISPEILRRNGLIFAANAATARDSSLGALEAMKNLGQMESSQALLAYGLLAEAAYQLNNIEGTKGTYETFQKLYFSSNLFSDSDKSQTAFILACAGRFYLKQKQTSIARKLFIQSQSHFSQLGNLAKYNLAAIYNDLGLIEEIDGKQKAAEMLFQQSYSLLKLSDKNNAIDRTRILNNLTDIAFRKGNYKSAILFKLESMTGLHI